MPAEDDSIAAPIFLNCFAQHNAQLEPGTLPGQPDEIVPEMAVELFHFLLTVG